jgi:hypothetical protein
MSKLLKGLQMSDDKLVVEYKVEVSTDGLDKKPKKELIKMYKDNTEHMFAYIEQGNKLKIQLADMNNELEGVKADVKLFRAIASKLAGNE